MTDVTFSDAALARTLGTNDPEAIAGLRAVLSDPEAEYTVAYVGLTTSDGFIDDPPLVLTRASNEIDRICRRFGIGVNQPPDRNGRTSR